MANQVINGKAFEYALLRAFYDRLREITNVTIIDNGPYRTAQRCFLQISEREKDSFRISASAAVNFLLDIEPRLSKGINASDELNLKISADEAGQNGDVRDVLLIRSTQNWEIGISAKNNHTAVKHSRLSKTIDFGEKWLGIPCSKEYFDKISPIFDRLEQIRSSNPLYQWKQIKDVHTNVYVPILNAFKCELSRLSHQQPAVVASRLVEYLIGNRDFYKVIRTPEGIEVQAYNFHGTLNLPFKNEKPKFKIRTLKLPSELIDIKYAPDSKTTIFVFLDEGWSMSFRIHSAKSTVEPSLKFDINLIGHPEARVTQHILHQ